MEPQSPGSPPRLTYSSRASTLTPSSDEILEPPSIGQFSRQSTLVDDRIRSSLSWGKEPFVFAESISDGASSTGTAQKKKWRRTFDAVSSVCLFSFNGWRVGVTWCAAAAGLALTMNTIWVIWAVATYGAPDGIGTMQAGSCTESGKLSQWLHFAINALSTILLASSNYTMQVLSSPTRDEVDRAHNKGVWLDIGVPSVRNMFHIAKTKRGLWWLLALSSVPLHLLYNSAVYSTLAVQQYNVYAAAERLILAPESDIQKAVHDLAINKTPNIYNAAGLEDPDLAGFRKWEKLDKSACIDAYAKDFNSAKGDLVLVTPDLNSNISSMVKVANEAGDFSTAYNFSPYGWMCEAPPLYPSSYKCSGDRVKRSLGEWAAVDQSTGQKLSIAYCFSYKVEERCTVEFSVIVMYIVIVANAIKACCMLMTLKVQHGDPLVTLGDAIQSFLRENDPTTKDKCLAGKVAFAKPKNFFETTEDGSKWHTKRHWWFAAASVRRWLICNILCMITIAVGGYLYWCGFTSLPYESQPLSSIWSMGVGTTNGNAIFGGGGGIFGNILLANLLQPILSFLFLTYNALYTCMLMSAEWFGYARHKKALRVTDPSGQQRSTYRLQLPYKYGVPLIVLSGLLHWLVSQTLFLVELHIYPTKNAPDKGVTQKLSALGFSCMAIIFTLSLGSLTVAVGILMGFRRYEGGMPLAGSCSAAISAACHQPWFDPDAATMPVMWGVSDEGVKLDFGEEEGGEKEGVGHCCFTSLSVGKVQEGKLYAGLRGRWKRPGLTAD